MGRRPRARPGALAPVLALLLLTAAAPVLGSAGQAGARASVLLFFDELDYIWTDVELAPNSSALCATIEACEALNLSLGYSMSQYGAFVTAIGDREAPGDFSWWWCLLLWNATGEAWEEAPVGASDLRLAGGDSICWCPNSSVSPAPSPLTRYPWPSFRGSTRNSGMTPGPSPVPGNVVWSADLANGPIDSTPAIADGRVFVSTGGVYNWTTMSYEKPPHLFALDASTGEVLWSAETSAAGWQVSSPAVGAGRVYLGTSDGRVLAFSEASGAPLWSFDAGASPTGVTSSPLVTREAVYVPSGDGGLYALTHEGELLWRFDLGGPAYMTTPALAGGGVLAGSDAGVLWCLGPDGAPLWNFTVDGKIKASPAVSDGRVYLISTVYEGWSAARSRLYALDASTGRLYWSLPLNASTSSPAVAGKTVFIGTSANIMAMDISGSGVWDIRTGGPVQSSPAVDGEFVYFSENVKNGTVRALWSSNGTAAWSFTPEPREYLLSSPALADGRLYFGSDNGRVYCLGPRASGEGTEQRERGLPAGVLLTMALAPALGAAAAALIALGRRWGRTGGER
ncbi:MAG: outer membrane protein assembly factor BamB family protein [Thermoplasmatota archaeon]